MNHVWNPNKLTNKLIFTHLTLHSKWSFSTFFLFLLKFHSRQTVIPSDWMPGILRIMQPLQRPLTLPMHGKGMPRMRLGPHHTPHTTHFGQTTFNEKYLLCGLLINCLSSFAFLIEVQIFLIESKHSFHSRAFHCVRIKTIYLITS